MQRCENCKEKLRGLYRVCPHCGFDRAPAKQLPSENVVIHLPPKEGVLSATAYMLGNGFTVEETSGTSVTFVGYEGPNIIIGLILMLLLFFLPGILYLLFGGRYRRVTLLLTPQGPQARGSRVLVGGESNAGREALKSWIDSLH